MPLQTRTDIAPHSGAQRLASYFCREGLGAFDAPQAAGLLRVSRVCAARLSPSMPLADGNRAASTKSSSIGGRDGSAASNSLVLPHPLPSSILCAHVLYDGWRPSERGRDGASAAALVNESERIKYVVGVSSEGPPMQRSLRYVYFGTTRSQAAQRSVCSGWENWPKLGGLGCPFGYTYQLPTGLVEMFVHNNVKTESVTRRGC